MKLILDGIWAWHEMTGVWLRGLREPEQTLMAILLIAPVLILGALVIGLICFYGLLGLLYLPFLIIRKALQVWLLAGSECEL